jgi:hypothetical protein
MNTFVKGVELQSELRFQIILKTLQTGRHRKETNYVIFT